MKNSLIIGAVMLDIVAAINTLPIKGEDSYINHQEMTIGGCAYNVADIFLKTHTPYILCAPVGNGMYGNFIAACLSRTGHQTAIANVNGDNGYCLCLVENDGERTFLTLPGVECQFRPEWLAKIDIKSCDQIYVSGYEIEGEGGEAIIEFLAKNRTQQLFYAPGPRIMFIDPEKNQRLFALNPILHLNEKEALDFTGCPNYYEAAVKLHSLTANLVIISLGSQGCFAYNGSANCLIPTAKVDVVDTIGAGDSHVAAFMVAQKSGMTLEDGLRFANHVSGKVVATKGPTLNEAITVTTSL